MDLGWTNSRIFNVHVFAEPIRICYKDLLVAIVVQDAKLGQGYSKQCEWYFMMSMALSSSP